MTEIKQLGAKDYDEIFSLSQYAFQYVLSKEALEKKKHEADRHIIWGVMDNEEIAAKLHLIPLTVYINGKDFEMGGISAVATWPEYRRKGMIKDLLLHALKYMKANGQTVSYLHPFSAPFYRQYGWEMTFAEKTYEIPIERLKKRWHESGFVKRINPDIPLLHDIYSRFVKLYNGALTRDEMWWQQRILNEDNQVVAVAYNNENQAEGYLIYEVKKEVFTVDEMAYCTPNGLKILLQFIANHDSMAKKVEMTVPENDNLPLLVEEPRFNQKVKPYFMARIVDVSAFLNQYIYQNSTKSFSLLLRVEDTFFSDNSGDYILEQTNGQVHVTRAAETKNQVAIQCSIQQLTSMFFGYKRPRELYDMGLISGNSNDIDQLDQIIPYKQTYFPDFF
ncbi:GNAT family N-acetyltransferase [Oceanobacillus halophilus]|uniref:GNAT family N-acetyltransferase n=1 Tax=Oceanobacillus halophilus TaxID=930130 RepID=A0A495A0V0_9BACI|nr:GNAT family N-acetyltransferase [Oceanobacillus halophilus]RKQ32282.1 GNAT family N-acetyltransferase [Oceanobacillus halophilus]